MRKIVLDIDGTISLTSNGDYENAHVIQSTKAKLLAYQQQGFEIILYTSRNMRTYENNTGKINAKTTPVLIDWLEKNAEAENYPIISTKQPALMGAGCSGPPE